MATVLVNSFSARATPRQSARRTARSALVRPAPVRCRAAAKARIVVRAELQDPLRNVQAAVNSFLRRYDILSTGIGAMIVTSYCVYAHGQDPFTALGITFTASVVALVANEVLFSDH